MWNKEITALRFASLNYAFDNLVWLSKSNLHFKSRHLEKKNAMMKFWQCATSWNRMSSCLSLPISHWWEIKKTSTVEIEEEGTMKGKSQKCLLCFKACFKHRHIGNLINRTTTIFAVCQFSRYSTYALWWNRLWNPAQQADGNSFCTRSWPCGK